MHLMIVLVQYLRVNSLKREWWIDLPVLTSIRLGTHAFWFNDNESTELIMRSGDDAMKWWIDLPKLTTLTTEGSWAFRYPRIITLESILFHSLLTNRHALSHHCNTWQRNGFPLQENRSHQESLFPPSLISRHPSRSFRLPLLSSFFHTPLFQTIHPTPY